MQTQDRTLLDGPFPRGGLTRSVSEGALLLNEQAPVRELALKRIRETGASVVRIPVDWRDAVSANPPEAFDASNPGDPAYSFARVDAAVIDAVAAGLTPLLVVSHAPGFAEAPHRWPYAFQGSWAPSPTALGEFAAALARRFDGSFADPPAPEGVLPRVRLFQAWNEPNLARYLKPQWVVAGNRWSAFSPLLYRQMLNGFYAGVKSVEPADEVVSAGVAPNGEPAGVGRMAPMTFLRTLLCLPTGTHARSRSISPRCADPPHFDVLDFHPLSIGDPDLPATSALDVSISDAAKITGLLRQAEQLHTALPAGEKPVWVTELNWESSPPAAHGVAGDLQASWVSRALHRLWVAGVSLVSWQFLVDPYPGLTLSTASGGTVELQRPAGLYSAGVGGNLESAQPKPFLRGFSLPFDPLRIDHRHIRAWALLMYPGEPVLLQRQTHDGRGWQTIARLRADPAGVLNDVLARVGTMQLRLSAGPLISAPASVPRGRSRL